MNKEFLEQELKNIEKEYSETTAERTKMQEEFTKLGNVLIKLEGRFEQTIYILNQFAAAETETAVQNDTGDCETGKNTTGDK
jgi:septal ring factor EnvC (AmiA/AmiB activator)